MELIESNKSNKSQKRSIEDLQPLEFGKLSDYLNAFLNDGSIGPIENLLIFDPNDSKINFVETFWDVFDVANDAIKSKRNEVQKFFVNVTPETETTNLYLLLKQLQELCVNDKLTKKEEQGYLIAFKQWEQWLNTLHDIRVRQEREARETMESELYDKIKQLF